MRASTRSPGKTTGGSDERSLPAGRRVCGSGAHRDGSPVENRPCREGLAACAKGRFFREEPSLKKCKRVRAYFFDKASKKGRKRYVCAYSI